MGTKQPGALVLLYVGDGQDPENYTRVAAQRVGGLTIGNEPIDVTSKDGSRWRALIEGGVRGLEMTGTGWISDAETFELLVNLASQGAIRTWQIHFANGITISGPCILSSTELSGEYTAAQAYTLNLASADDVSVTGLGFDTVRFSASSYVADDGSVQLTVTRTDEGNLNAVTVQYATADGSAEAGVNYPASTGTLSWGPGDTSSRTITISDLVADVDDLTFAVHLSDVDGAVIGSPGTATVTIPSIAVQLIGLSWQLPCMGPLDGGACVCAPSVSSSTVFEAPPGTYNVTFRVRGVVELATYSGGSLYSAPYVYQNKTGQTPSVANAYRVHVSSPAKSYYINNGVIGSPIPALDYEVTIPIDAGATVTLDALTVDNAEINNDFDTTVVDDDPTRPIIVIQPYDGQFAQIDAVSVVKLS